MDDLTSALAAELTTARRREEVLTMNLLVPMTQDELWAAVTDPARTASWSPVVPDRVLDQEGPATSRENPTDEPVDATVLEARAPWFLEHRWGPDTLGWQLAPSGESTMLNLVHQLSKPELAIDMAAGWHICLTVLRLQAEGHDVPRCVGQDAVAAGWEQLRARYAEVIPDPTPEDDEPTS